MTLKELESLIMLQNDLSDMANHIVDEDVFVYTISLMIERWCRKHSGSPALVAKSLFKRLRRKK